MKIGCLVAILGFLVFAYLVSRMVDTDSDSRPAQTARTSATSTSPATAATPQADAPGSQWSYDHNDDAMAKGTIHHASVTSTNTVNFQFPYAGPQHATLTLRSHPRYGRNVIFSIEKGQILCRSYDGCTVLVRFDDAEPVQYAAAGPEDNSTTTIFIRDYNGFLNRMKKAKKVRVSPNIYREGAPVFEFDVSNFDEAKYRPKQ